MWKRPLAKDVGEPFSPCGRINFLKAFRQRLGCSLFLECQYLVVTQERFNCPTESCPKLNLAGNRTFGKFAGEARVQNKGIG